MITPTMSVIRRAMPLHHRALVNATGQHHVLSMSSIPGYIDAKEVADLVYR